MTLSASTNTGFGVPQLAVQVLTASATLKADARFVILNKTTTLTATLPAAPGSSGEVWYFQNPSVADHTLTAASGVTFDGSNQSLTIPRGASCFIVSASTDLYFVFWTSNHVQVVSSAGAISIPYYAKVASVIITGGSATAATLAAPTAGVHDGLLMTITAGTAQAHTVTQTTPGFNSGSTSSDVGTYGGAIGDSMIIVAYNGVWHILNVTNVTVA